MRRNLLIVGVVFGSLALFAAVLHFALPDGGNTKDVAEIVQASVTALAIVAGGIFAGYKLQIFRDFEPHLTISQTVSHRFIGESYVHIAVTADLKNSSRVEMEIRNGMFRLQHMAPVSDHDVESLYSQVSEAKESEEFQEFQWPTLVQDPRNWDKNEFIIEPGESHQETVEFIVRRKVESALVYTYFYNSKFFPGSRSSQGWGATTTYDIMDANHANGRINGDQDVQT